MSSSDFIEGAMNISDFIVGPNEYRGAEAEFMQKPSPASSSSFNAA
jgi:hypothetical protein